VISRVQFRFLRWGGNRVQLRKKGILSGRRDHNLYRAADRERDGVIGVRELLSRRAGDTMDALTVPRAEADRTI